MDKIEFTRDELYEKMKYIIFCIECEHSIKGCRSHDIYQDFLGYAAEGHYGDCTKQNCPCSRCLLNDIEINAQNTVDSLFPWEEETLEEPVPPDVEDIGESDVSCSEEKGEWKEYDMGGGNQQ